MSNGLTVQLVALIKENGAEAVQESYQTAKAIVELFAFDNEPRWYPPRPRRPAKRRKTITATELAERTDWTGKIGEFFAKAEALGKTEVPMRDVVEYVVKNTDRNSVTGSAYAEYVKAAETIGWRRSYTGKGGIKARTWVKVS